MDTDKHLTDKHAPGSVIDPETEHAMIAERAYLKAKQRNFTPGFELDDWLEAEREIKNQSLYWRIG